MINFCSTERHENTRFPLCSLSILKLLVLVIQLCPTLCDPTDCSPPGSSVRGILQARILKWVAIPSPGDLPDAGIEPRPLALQILYHPWATPVSKLLTFTSSSKWKTMWKCLYLHYNSFFLVKRNFNLSSGHSLNISLSMVVVDSQ